MKVSGFEDRSLEMYGDIIGWGKVEEVKNLAEPLRGLGLTHVNSTSFGGGVTEILYTMVPLMNSVGLKTVWEVIEAPEEFFKVTKLIHNALQGAGKELTDEMKELYLKVNHENAERLDLDGDFIVVHDPQPLGLRRFRKNSRIWIWRCHIDLSKPYKPVWEFIADLLSGYDASIYHLKEYIYPEIPTPRKYVMPPSIDPLSPKNKPLPTDKVEETLRRYDVDPERPIIVQVARFDPWKDPLGAIDVYRLVKEKIPGVQLLMVASMAYDDPEGWIYYEKTLRRAGEDPDIHFLTNLVGVGALEVNAFQRAADVALQLSIREGFGLAVAEALWKKTPVVARPSGGIRLQVIDGVTGYLVKTIKEAAEKTIYLIKHPEERKRLGENGYQHVKENFIVTKHLENYLRILNELYVEKKRD